MLEAYEPDLVLVSAGFDAAIGDPIGRCEVSPLGFYEITRALMHVADGKVLIALEGGYNLQSISNSMAACAGALLGDGPIAHREHYPATPLQPCHAAMVVRVREHLSKWWPALKTEPDAMLAAAAEEDAFHEMLRQNF